MDVHLISLEPQGMPAPGSDLQPLYSSRAGQSWVASEIDECVDVAIRGLS